MENSWEYEALNMLEDWEKVVTLPKEIHCDQILSRCKVGKIPYHYAEQVWTVEDVGQGAELYPILH